MLTVSNSGTMVSPSAQLQKESISNETPDKQTLLSQDHSVKRRTSNVHGLLPFLK